MNAEVEIGGLARGQRTVRTFCGARPAVCNWCVEILEADREGELVCPRCGRRSRADAQIPCPRAATVTITDEDGCEDRFCDAHEQLWRRLAGALHGGKVTSR